MRVNTTKALAAWRKGKAAKVADSVWTDGVTLYSYATALLTRSGGRVIYNATKYSPTTSRHQAGIVADLQGEAYVTVDSMPRGTQGYGLSMAARDA